MVALRKIVSSNLEAVGYDEGQQQLVIRFKKAKHVWGYNGVSRDLYEQFMAAPSKGVFFAQRIKNQYPAQRLMIEADLLEGETAS